MIRNLPVSQLMGCRVAIQTRRNALRTHLSHQFTIFFAPLHFLYLDRLAKEILATCEHISFIACFAAAYKLFKDAVALSSCT